MAYRRDELRWNGWGRKDVGFEMHGHDDAVWRFLAETVGLASLPHTPATDLEHLALPPSRLPDGLLDALREATSSERALTSDFERAFHALGRSYPDLIRLRSESLDVAPDAVVYPESAEEVLAVLERCMAAGVAVVPFGGGSSVVGGVEADGGQTPAGRRPVVTLDTTRMCELSAIDPVSRTATFGAGIYGPDLEEALQAEGFTLGHFPQSFEFSTLGGWIAARGAGQQSNRYGAADDWLVAAKVATPRGEWRTLPFPHSAAGPDLNAVIAGSEGVLGVITEATVAIHELPESRDYRAYLFRDFESGAAAIRRMVQADLPTAMMRLSDADETHFFGTFKSLIHPPGSVTQAGERILDAVGFGPGQGEQGRCALMVGLEGTTGEVRYGLAQTLAICAREGGLPVGKGPGSAWWAQRFAMPYLRDPMLDRGVGIDTLETSTEWSNVAHLRRAVRGAIRAELGPNAAVLCHISHSYPDGCSLYFTFFFARDDGDAIGQWRRVKIAASDALRDHGGTISHHHGVGRDHAPWMAAEKGALGIDVLRAMKRELDPTDVMNPGKLF